jgi:hypothetical protein
VTEQILLNHLLSVINRSYKTTRPPNGINNSRSGKADEKSRVGHLVEFCLHHPLELLTDEQAGEIWDWLHKWAIHPGEFEWGVDWSQIKAEQVTCTTCKGEGRFPVTDIPTTRTEHCWYCGGKGYQNRAPRGVLSDY